MPDDSGFFYFRQRALPAGAPETDKYQLQTAYFHRLGGKGPDRAILQAGTSTEIAIAPAEFPNVTPVTGTPYMTAIPGNGMQNEFSMYLARTSDLGRPAIPWRKLFDARDDVTGYAIHGDDLFLLSHRDALRFKVLRTSATHPDLEHADVVVAPGREVIVGINAAADGLYVQARDGTVARLYRVA